MGKNDLTKKEALDLIAPVVDDEASDAERKAFMEYIAQDEEVRQEYESIKRVKLLVRSRCPSVSAPDSLKEYVRTISHQEASLNNVDIPIYDMPGGGPADLDEESTNGSNRAWIYSIAATFLIAALAWGFFELYQQQPAQPQTIYNIEEYAYEHFKKHNGQFVTPNISTASLGSAEITLAQNYDMAMTIPALENAEFKGVVYGEFVPNYEAPMLEYHLPSEDQYIYIFAFKLDKLKEFGRLDRYKEAVEKCNDPQDFHIRNVNGKHVVSWKWDDVWYAAISNHNGNTLASLVEPLQYDLESSE